MERRAGQLVGVTAVDFHLYGGVSSEEQPRELPHHTSVHLLRFPGAEVRGHDVATARHEAWSDHPDVPIVRIEHAGDLVDCGGARV